MNTRQETCGNMSMEGGSPRLFVGLRKATKRCYRRRVHGFKAYNALFFRLGQMAKAFYLIVPKSSSIIPVSVGHRAKSQSTVGQVMVPRDSKGTQPCPAGRPQQGMPSRLEGNVAVDQNRGT